MALPPPGGPGEGPPMAGPPMGMPGKEGGPSLSDVIEMLKMLPPPMLRVLMDELSTELEDKESPRPEMGPPEGPADKSEAIKKIAAMRAGGPSGVA
tara:strand:- start:1067 stop:1354 length:288 start_codon:yes stop_codon:yes gene_type:complete